MNNEDGLYFHLLLTHNSGPVYWGGGVGDKEGSGTLATAVVMTAVTDDPVIFIPGSLGGLTSFRVVLYCTLEEENPRNK